MRKLLAIICGLALTGCAWLGLGDDSETTAATEPAVQAAEPAPAQEAVTPAKTTAKKTTAKASKNTKSEAQIKAELDATGKKLVDMSARNLLPNRSKPDYKQVGGQWVATFTDVDTQHVTTQLRPGATPGNYVGIIRYQERYMQCTGKTKAAALQGDCKQIRTANRSEMIRYDGNRWQD